MDRFEIIRRIGQIRNKANLSARELSLRIELNDGYINRLESKKDFLPSMEVLLRIISACGSTPSEFFYYDIEAYKADQEVIEYMRCFNVKTKKLMRELMETLKNGKI